MAVSDNITTCIHCGAKNRLGNPPAGQVPVCGACKKPLPWLVNATQGLTPGFRPACRCWWISGPSGAGPAR